jgi:hypothetical protein
MGTFEGLILLHTRQQKGPLLLINIKVRIKDVYLLFQYLLAGLPDSFKTLKQSLDANTSSDVYDKLEILERNEKEYDLSARAESANTADAGKPRNPRQKKRYTDKVQCFFCGEEHLRTKCELRELLTAMVSEFQISKAREEKRNKSKSKSSAPKTKALDKRTFVKGILPKTSQNKGKATNQRVLPRLRTLNSLLKSLPREMMMRN